MDDGGEIWLKTLSRFLLLKSKKVSLVAWISFSAFNFNSCNYFDSLHFRRDCHKSIQCTIWVIFQEFIVQWRRTYFRSLFQVSRIAMQKALLCSFFLREITASVGIKSRKQFTLVLHTLHCIHSCVSLRHTFRRYWKFDSKFACWNAQAKEKEEARCNGLNRAMDPTSQLRCSEGSFPFRPTTRRRNVKQVEYQSRSGFHSIFN